MATQTLKMKPMRLPIFSLFHPQEELPLVVGTLLVGLLVGWFEMTQFGWPLWAASATVLGLMVIPGVVKWQTDARRYGGTVMVLSILLFAQGFHTIEHIVQWVQFHILNWAATASTGLLSPANAEWVHFIWNWLVLLIVTGLVSFRVKNLWAWLLVAVVVAHTLEHSYMFVRYLEVLDQLKQMGIKDVTAQGLPGVLGSDGWLARSDLTQGTFLCHLPFLTTANRLDIHFTWNILEMSLLLLTANRYMGKFFSPPIKLEKLQGLPT